MFVIDDIASYFVNIGIGKIEQFYEKHKLEGIFKEIEEEITESVNKKYETEVFFDDFSRYYSVNKITEKILDRIIDVAEQESVESMLMLLNERFIQEYKQYSPYSTQIKAILNNIYHAIYKGITESDVLSDGELTRLLVAKYARQQSEKVSELNDNIQDMHKDVKKIEENTKIFTTQVCDNSHITKLTQSYQVLNEKQEGTFFNSEYDNKIKKIKTELQEPYNFKEAKAYYDKEKGISLESIRSKMHDITNKVY